MPRSLPVFLGAALLSVSLLRGNATLSLGNIATTSEATRTAHLLRSPQSTIPREEHLDAARIHALQSLRVGRASCRLLYGNKEPIYHGN